MLLALLEFLNIFQHGVAGAGRGLLNCETHIPRVEARNPFSQLPLKSACYVSLGCCRLKANMRLQFGAKTVPRRKPSWRNSKEAVSFGQQQHICSCFSVLGSLCPMVAIVGFPSEQFSTNITVLACMASFCDSLELPEDSMRCLISWINFFSA